MNVKCKICGNVKKNKRAKFCSISCANKNRSVNKPKQECDWCKTEFHRRKSHAKRGRSTFCSKHCEMEFRRKDRIDVECVICSKKFKVQPSLKNRKYCSQKCMGVDVRERNKNRTPQYRSFMECAAFLFLKANLNTKVIPNDREILEGYELDIWIPKLNVGIEYNGPHHYKPIYGDDVFKKTKLADKCKRGIAKRKNVRIITIDGSKISGWNGNDVSKLFDRLINIFDIKNPQKDITKNEIILERKHRY